MRVKFSIQIHSCAATMSSNDVFLDYAVDLPFAPFPGLTFSDGDDTCIGPINSVNWDHRTQSFDCDVEPDTTFYDSRNPLANYSETLGFKDLVQKYISAGWSKRQ